MKAKLFLSVCLSFAFFVASAVSPAPMVHDVSGTYDFTVTDIPDQPDVKGTMTLSKIDGGVKVDFNSSAGEIALSDAKLVGHTLTGKIDVQGVVLKLKVEFKGNSFSGAFASDYGDLPISGDKK